MSVNSKYRIGILAIVAVIVLLAVFTPKANKNDPEKQFGYRLFQLGNATTAYANANPESFTPQDERLAFYGYGFLQPEFLANDFNLSGQGFKIADVEPEKGPVKIVFNVRETGLENYFLEVELIEVGEISFGQGRDISSALRAITYASNHRHEDKVPEVSYSLEITTDNAGKQKAYIIGKDKELAKAEELSAAEGTFVPSMESK